MMEIFCKTSIEEKLTMFLLINKLKIEWPLLLQLGYYRTLTFDSEFILACSENNVAG